ncbi:hypothetical protein BT69DRAFT_1288395 [Atractiella rhizophila]|nr:hypothetical protein BT69DRAFT_1288395 [Atractiella rhizophila]
MSPTTTRTAAMTTMTRSSPIRHLRALIHLSSSRRRSSHDRSGPGRSSPTSKGHGESVPISALGHPTLTLTLAPSARALPPTRSIHQAPSLAQRRSIVFHSDRDSHRHFLPPASCS